MNQTVYLILGLIAFTALGQPPHAHAGILPPASCPDPIQCSALDESTVECSTVDTCACTLTTCLDPGGCEVTPYPNCGNISLFIAGIQVLSPFGKTIPAFVQVSVLVTTLGTQISVRDPRVITVTLLVEGAAYPQEVGLRQFALQGGVVTLTYLVTFTQTGFETITAILDPSTPPFADSATTQVFVVDQLPLPPPNIFNLALSTPGVTKLDGSPLAFSTGANPKPIVPAGVPVLVTVPVRGTGMSSVGCLGGSPASKGGGGSGCSVPLTLQSVSETKQQSLDLNRLATDNGVEFKTFQTTFAPGVSGLQTILLAVNPQRVFQETTYFDNIVGIQVLV
ncbi:MAG: hypothetical protein HY074_01800, partial [Deltaproteobacteria bacterium]|nr:hypothetical protein [Deltaproteobacteria bacterium]